MDRKNLKNKSKIFLKNYYWETFLLVFIISVLSGGGTLVREYGGGHIVIWGSMFIFLINIFLVNVLIVGLAKYFVEGEKGNVSKKYLFYYFNKDTYLDVVEIMFITTIKKFLWSLLFLIPGIVKSYEYYFIPYLIVDGFDKDEIFNKTKEMTFNKKWDLFVLDLSFLGWYLLGALLFGIGVVFVTPYHENVKFQAYNSLK